MWLFYASRQGSRSQGACLHDWQVLEQHMDAFVWQVVQDALDDFLAKKKSRLSCATARALLRAVPSPAAWLPLLLRHAQAPRNEFLKCEALQLLAATLQPTKVSSTGACSGRGSLLPCTAVCDLGSHLLPVTATIQKRLAQYLVVLCLAKSCNLGCI